MISKTVKAKRRQNRAYHQHVAAIKVICIDNRQRNEGTEFFLLSLPITNRSSHHIEARERAAVLPAYRKRLAKCRELSRSA